MAVSVVPGKRLPVVDAPVAELPDLDDADLWAHVEVTLPDGPPPASLPDYLRQHPAAARARLLSPRRLAPGTGYVACLVPAFEVGRLTGLGESACTGAGTLAPAWTYAPGSTAKITLPVYDSWSFRTGGAADFESLARAIRPHVVPPEAAERRFALDPAVGAGRSLPLRGALRPVRATPVESEPVPAAVADAIAERINRAADLAEAGGAPVLGSPLYGGMPAAPAAAAADRHPGVAGDRQHRPAQPDRRGRRRGRGAAAPGGLRGRGVAAGGPTRRGQRTAARRAGRAGCHRPARRPAPETLPEDTLLQLAGPALARVPTTGGTPTVFETVVTSAVPEAGFEGSFRRITRARGPQLRRFGTASTTLGWRPHVRAGPAAGTPHRLVGGGPGNGERAVGLAARHPDHDPPAQQHPHADARPQRAPVPRRPPPRRNRRVLLGRPRPRAPCRRVHIRPPGRGTRWRTAFHGRFPRDSSEVGRDGTAAGGAFGRGLS